MTLSNLPKWLTDSIAAVAPQGFTQFNQGSPVQGALDRAGGFMQGFGGMMPANGLQGALDRSKGFTAPLQGNRGTAPVLPPQGNFQSPGWSPFNVPPNRFTGVQPGPSGQWPMPQQPFLQGGGMTGLGLQAPGEGDYGLQPQVGDNVNGTGNYLQGVNSNQGSGPDYQYIQNTNGYGVPAVGSGNGIGGVRYPWQY